MITAAHTPGCRLWAGPRGWRSALSVRSRVCSLLPPPTSHLIIEAANSHHAHAQAKQTNKPKREIVNNTTVVRKRDKNRPAQFISLTILHTHTNAHTTVTKASSGRGRAAKALTPPGNDYHSIPYVNIFKKLLIPPSNPHSDDEKTESGPALISGTLLNSIYSCQHTLHICYLF